MVVWVQTRHQGSAEQGQKCIKHRYNRLKTRPSSLWSMKLAGAKTKSTAGCKVKAAGLNPEFQSILISMRNGAEEMCNGVCQFTKPTVCQTRCHCHIHPGQAAFHHVMTENVLERSPLKMSQLPACCAACPVLTGVFGRNITDICVSGGDGLRFLKEMKSAIFNLS